MVQSAAILSCIAMLAVRAPSAAKVQSVSDIEPNDMLDDAVDTGLTDLGAVVVIDGQIGNGEWAEDDNDLFAFHVSEQAELPRLVTVAMKSFDADLDGYLTVYDGTGQDVARNNDGDYPNLGPYLAAYLLAPGTYYAGVSSKGGFDPTFDRGPSFLPPIEGMPYELEIVLGLGPSLIESLEPSPDEDLPVTVESLPSSAQNQFIGDGPALWLDVDRYWAVVAGPAILTVDVTPTELEVLDPLVRITILDSTGAAVVEPFETKRPDLRGARLEVAIFEPSAVEIEIRGTLPPLTSKDDSIGTVGFYDISLEAVAVNSGGGPLEPNDSLLEATPVSISKPGVANYLAIMGARDRPTIDPMASGGVPAGGFPQLGMAKHLLDGGPGSTGSYDITISVGVNQDAGCGNRDSDTDARRAQACPQHPSA